MLVKNAEGIVSKPVEGLEGVTIRWLWGPDDGAPNFALRLFEVEPGASTFHHMHPYEHEVFILSGQAVLRGETMEHHLAAGSTALVMPDEIHQFVNPGPEILRFLCAIPMVKPAPGAVK